MLKASLQLRLGQQLTMTPQLQQAIKLLQMPSLELQAHLKEILESNVMLEAEEELENTTSFEALGAGPAEQQIEQSDAVAETDGANTATVEVLDDNWTEAASASFSDGGGHDDDDRATDIEDESGQSLQEHLLWQWELAQLEPRSLAIGRAMIDAITDDGYLAEPLDSIAATLAPEVIVEPGELDRILRVVQRLDPLGVGARNLGECISLQLRALDENTPGLNEALCIAAGHLDRVAARELPVLRRLVGCTEEVLELALLLIRGCHPRPGSQLGGPAPEFVVPDVIVRRSGKGWTVEANPVTLPKLRVNQGFADLLGRSGSHANLRGQLQEARWLLKSLEIRHETLLKVARSIAERQTEFLEQGEEFMRPMILKDIAEAVEMHESTISRVTHGKYMLTPRGVFELRYFFSSQVESQDGSGTSSTAIRAKIRKLIRDEPPEAPLSDSRIAELLSKEGIPVARRTVAKYREAMEIAPSNERKR